MRGGLGDQQEPGEAGYDTVTYPDISIDTIYSILLPKVKLTTTYSTTSPPSLPIKL